MRGQEIKALREELGLTQTKFGIILGYKTANSGQMISDLEREKGGRRLPGHLIPLLILLKASGIEPLRDYLEAQLTSLENASAKPN